MSVVPGHIVLVGTAHMALGCVTSATGETVCNGTSTGFFAGLGALLFVYLALLVLGIVAAVKVVTKAGYSGWWILITIIPLVGTVFVFIFAFSTWPIMREVQMLRAQLAEQRGYGGYRGGPGGGPGPARPHQGVPGSTGPTPATPDDSSGQQAALPAFGSFLAGGSMVVATTPGPSPTNAPPAAGTAPAGWYPVPGDASGQLRYWNGSTWTDQFRSPS